MVTCKDSCPRSAVTLARVEESLRTNAQGRTCTVGRTHGSESHGRSVALEGKTLPPPILTWNALPRAARSDRVARASASHNDDSVTTAGSRLTNVSGSFRALSCVNAWLHPTKTDFGADLVDGKCVPRGVLHATGALMAETCGSPAQAPTYLGECEGAVASLFALRDEPLPPAAEQLVVVQRHCGRCCQACARSAAMPPPPAQHISCRPTTLLARSCSSKRGSHQLAAVPRFHPSIHVRMYTFAFQAPAPGPAAAPPTPAGPRP